MSEVLITSDAASREAHALTLLAIAEMHDLPARVVRSVSVGFYVPAEVAADFTEELASSVLEAVDTEREQARLEQHQLLHGDGEVEYDHETASLVPAEVDPEATPVPEDEPEATPVPEVKPDEVAPTPEPESTPEPEADAQAAEQPPTADADETEVTVDLTVEPPVEVKTPRKR